MLLVPLLCSFYPKLAETSLVWAAPISLATTLGITFVFFSSGYLDVSVPRVCLPRLAECLAFCQTGCPIQISWDLGLFAAPPSFSQLITSFFAFMSLGILRLPLFAFFLFSRWLELFLVVVVQYVNDLFFFRGE